MKKGFKLFLAICFMFTFVFSLAFAGDGPPVVEGCDLGCCEIEATTQCSAGMGLFQKIDGICVCVTAPIICEPEPICW